MAVRIRAGILLTGRTDGDMAVWLDDVADDSAELADNWSMSWTNRCLPRGRPELAKMVRCKIMASAGFDPVTSAMKVEQIHHSGYMGSWYVWLGWFI